MTIFINPWVSAHGLNIERSAGAKLYFYDTGTTTPKIVYSDINESVAYTQPVVADSRGVFPLIYFSGLARVVMCDRDGTPASPIRTADPIYNKIGTVTIVGNFNSSTNAGNYPSTGDKGDMWRVVESFRLNSVSGSHVLNVGDSIVCNKSGATGVDADWDIVRGKATTDGVKTLSYATTINTDCANASTFLVTLTGNATLANPSNMIVGKTYCWIVRQDAIGGRSLSLATYFKVSGAFGLRDQPNAITVLYGTVKTSSEIALSVAGINSPPGVVTLTPGATVATDCSKGRIFVCSAHLHSGDVVFSNPTNITPGEIYTWRIGADQARDYTFGTYFEFGGGGQTQKMNARRKGSPGTYALVITGVALSSTKLCCRFEVMYRTLELSVETSVAGGKTLLGDVFHDAFYTLSGATTLNISNWLAGQHNNILIKQDATGGRALTLGSSFQQIGRDRIDPRPNAYSLIQSAIYGDPATAICKIHGLPPAIEYTGSIAGGGGDFIVTCPTMGSNLNVSSRLVVEEVERKTGGASSWRVSGYVKLYVTSGMGYNSIQFTISGLPGDAGMPFVASGYSWTSGVFSNPEMAEQAFVKKQTTSPYDNYYYCKLRGTVTHTYFHCVLDVLLTSKPTWAY